MTEWIAYAFFIALLPFGAVAQDNQVAVDTAPNNDLAIEIQEWRVLANQGHAREQNYLGTIYEDGTYVKQDYAEAFRWYQMAAEQGLAVAQFNLGDMYIEGLGVPQDYSKAFLWYQMAAAQGHAGAHFNLGVMYFNGQGVLQDYVKSHMWFNIASINLPQYGATNRDDVAGSMTASDISEAQRRARICIASAYQDCE